MSGNSQNFALPAHRFPLSSHLLDDGREIRVVGTLGLLGAGLIALFFLAPWTVPLIGALVILGLSAIESEAFLLFIIYTVPLVWVMQGNEFVRNVSVPLRFLVFIGFFAGRLFRGQLQANRLFHSTVSRASLLFFCAAVVPTILDRGELTYEFWRAAYQLASYVAFYFVILAWTNSPQRLQKALWAVLASTVVVALFALYQQIVGSYTALWAYLNPQDELTPPWSGRSTSFMGHPNSLACYLNLVLPLALVCCVLGKGKWRRMGGWTLGLGFLALLSTQSLGGLIAFGSTLTLAIFCFARGRMAKLLLFTGLGSLACLFFLLPHVLNPSHPQAALESDAATRLLLWGTAWTEFVQAPVFGLGWGNFGAPFDWNLSFAPGMGEPHNVYLQLLAETGLFGFMAFFYLVLQSARQGRRLLNSSHYFFDKVLGFGLLGAIGSVLVHGSEDIPIFVQSGTLLWMLLGLLVARLGLEQRPERPL